MILSFSHEHIWTTDEPLLTNHLPYFLIEDKNEAIPILNDVTNISDNFEMDSWVNWNNKVKARRVYVTHPKVTPVVSTAYYRLGYTTWEQSVPYLTRLTADLEAEGKWPFNTNGNWEKVKCLIYDIETIREKDSIPCTGLGEFEFEIKSSYNLDNEDFKLETKFDDKLKVTQLLADNRSTEYQDTFIPLVKKFQENHFIIGHNILEWDNIQIYDRLKAFGDFRSFIRERTYEHEFFQRGKHAKRMLTIYPLSFDTLHTARFIWRGESEVGYGLKQLAQKFKIPVCELNENDFVKWDKPTKRIYSDDFGGFGNWSNTNNLCLLYNNHDIQETYGIFKLQLNAILISMFISGLNFEDVVSGSNGRLADHLSLVRGYNKIINPPMQRPNKVAAALYGHFKGELKTKKEIFDFFRDHKCTWDCIPVVKTDKLEIEIDEDEEDEEESADDTDGMTPGETHEKLLRVVKYGEEMPEYVTYYPFLYSPYSKKEQRKDPKKRAYIAVGGKTVDPTEPMEPRHDVWKGDTNAQYPSITKSKNIVSDTVKLSRKNEKIDGWCWFRRIYHKNILDLFEWKHANEFSYSDGEGYFIGYQNRGREGLVNKALTGIIKAVQEYKKKPGWDEAYQKTLKPMRNALTHGVMLALDATCQQYNIAGCAIPTVGQEITTDMNAHLEKNGWKILESDTDGTEFRKVQESAPDFDNLVGDIEKSWSEKLHFPVVFDREHSKHKLFITHKNYVTVKDNDEAKLTGNTLHSRKKPKIAEKCMKKLMLDVLPVVDTKQQLVGKIQERAYPIVKENMKNVDESDLVMVQFVKPSNSYDSGIYQEWSLAIQEVTKTSITDPGTAIEFVVCEERLPGVHGPKTLSTPLSYMWPREFAKTIDKEWYEDFTFSYFDTAFGFEKVSTKMQIKPLFGFDTVEVENVVKSERAQQSSLSSFTTSDSSAKDVDVPKQRKLF
jgi:hypothetical protein